MMRNKFCLLIALSVLSVLMPATVSAVTSDADIKELKRPVIGFYNVEIGRRQALSTYLSPFSYKGTAFALSGFWTKALPVNPLHLSMNFESRVDFGRLLNPSKTALEYDIHAEFQWGIEWKTRLPHNFIVGGGGTAGAYGGLLYLPRNGNNPAAAQFAAGIGLTGSAGWHHTIGKLPVLITERINLPFLSGFFCPEYGETYYEIYLGNHSHLAHFGWFGNRFGLDNLFSVSLDFGRTAMQIGYRFSMQTEYANKLNTKIFNHAFVIGVIPGGLGLKQKRKDIVTPLY